MPTLTWTAPNQTAGSLAASKTNKNDTIMKRIKTGILLGVIAGIIDVIPMVMQKLTWDANISAFSMWIVVGFLLATIDLKLNSIIKGILIAFLVLLPTAILISWKEPFSLIPIVVMTTILGGLLGFSIQKTIGSKE
jgi:glycopeptide antibiotics resistance protein